MPDCFLTSAFTVEKITLIICRNLYAVTAHALDQATPSVNIALTPYTTYTTWYKDGKETEAGAAF